MALNSDTKFPPTGNPPYRLNREWCVGDSLGYINANSENFDNRLITLEDKTNISNTSSPFKKLNDILTTAPIFVPVNYSSASAGGNNTNVVLDNRYLPTTVPEYAGWTKDDVWWSPSFFVTLPGLIANGGTLPNTNISNSVPRTVAILAKIRFNTNSAGNNGTTLYIKQKDSAPNSTTFNPSPNQYIDKIGLDPTGGPGVGWEAESEVTIPIYLDTQAPGIPNTFSWRIRHALTENPWRQREFTVLIYLAGYYIQYPTFVA